MEWWNNGGMFSIECICKKPATKFTTTKDGIPIYMTKKITNR